MPPRTRKPGSASQPRIALALAGGGPLGAIYEIGALCALEECIDGLDLTRLQHYVGVSAGAFLSASLANGFTPRELCTGFIESKPSSAGMFDPSWMTMPAWREWLGRGLRAPGLTAQALWRWGVQQRSFISAAERLSAVLPTGLFDNTAIDRELSKIFNQAGRSNDFRQLKTRLTLVATHLDSGEAIPFGAPGFDHIPISKAVQASSALPGLFPPVEIDGEHYVDGALKKTMHASVALDEGVDLLICLNPLVPFDTTPHTTPHSTSSKGRTRTSRELPRIVEGGLPAVLNQTFRSIIHSRMALGMKSYEKLYPQTDIVLFEPDRHDVEMYAANTFSYRERKHLAEHAYQQTRKMLRARVQEWTPLFERHGLRLNLSALHDSARKLLPEASTASPSWPQARERLDETLDTLDGLHASLVQAAQSAQGRG